MSTCKNCGFEMKTDTDVCPQCRKPTPNAVAKIKKFIFALVGLLVFSLVVRACFDAMYPDQPAPVAPAITQSPAPEKKAADFLDADTFILRTLKQMSVEPTITDSPLADGSKRRMYRTAVSLIEIIGAPKVKESTVIIGFSETQAENAIAMFSMVTVFCAVCMNGDLSQNDKMVGEFNKYMEQQKLTQFNMGSCAVTFQPMTAVNGMTASFKVQ